MPIEHAVPGYRFPRPDGRAELRSMPGSEVPVIHQPFVEGDLLPFWSHAMPVDDGTPSSRARAGRRPGGAVRAARTAMRQR